MGYTETAMGLKKRIALVAHDNKKEELLDWAGYNKDLLARHEVYATGTTGRLLEAELGFEVTKLRSGPPGGDMQIGARIADGDIDLLIFFCDRASADFIISSPLMSDEYQRQLPDTEGYAVQRIP